MQAIPLQQTPSQLIRSVLGGQNFQLLIYQKPQGLFVDVNVDGVDVVTAVIARDTVPIICRDYIGVQGNILFVDTQGDSDPEYSEFGMRYSLLYLTQDEYEQL